MSQRPPCTYRILVTGTGPSGSTDSGNFTLAASGPTNVPGALGATLHLNGIEFYAAANGGVFISSPDTLPSGVAAPHNITEIVSAPWWHEILVASIDGATTAFPFALCYGPLGIGGR